MKEKSRNLVASVRQRLLNLSQERGEDPNLIFIRYALERFLYRLSRSRQSGKFILKGARPMGLRQAAGYGSFSPSMSTGVLIFKTNRFFI
jgi:hypothetical protein